MRATQSKSAFRRSTAESKNRIKVTNSRNQRFIASENSQNLDQGLIGTKLKENKRAKSPASNLFRKRPNNLESQKPIYDLESLMRQSRESREHLKIKNIELNLNNLKKRKSMGTNKSKTRSGKDELSQTQSHCSIAGGTHRLLNNERVFLANSMSEYKDTGSGKEMNKYYPETPKMPERNLNYSKSCANNTKQLIVVDANDITKSSMEFAKAKQHLLGLSYNSRQSYSDDAIEC